jgi:hypothetical protein
MPTINLNKKTWEKFEEGCVTMTVIRRKPVTVAELAKHVIDKYADQAIGELIEEEKKK